MYSTTMPSVELTSGRCWSFGRHALLPEAHIWVVWRLLQCRKCHLRILYQSLAARELKSELEKNCSLTFFIGFRHQRIARHHFHSLTRLIRAVLLGLAMKRHASTDEDLYCFGSSLSNKFHIISSKAWVCIEHGRELFDMLYNTDEDTFVVRADSNHSVPIAADERYAQLILPPGRSNFFRCCLRMDKLRPSIPAPLESSSSASTVIDFSLGSAPADPSSTSHLLASANSRWSSFYEASNSLSILDEPPSECLSHGWSTESLSNSFSCMPSTMCDYQATRIALAQGPRVRFPERSPVTAIHNLVRYSLASKLERSNRIWEWNSFHRLIEARNRVTSHMNAESDEEENSLASTEDGSEINNYNDIKKVGLIYEVDKIHPHFCDHIETSRFINEKVFSPPVFSLALVPGKPVEAEAQLQ
ncbi:unnamed protein product, partial [Protopolystoma xenopodis]